MIHYTYTFNHLPAHELVPYLVMLSQTHGVMGAHDVTLDNGTNSDTKCDVKNTKTHAAWHICWLNNNHNPIIGLLPKTSWQVDFVSDQNAVSAHHVTKTDKTSDANTVLNIEIIKASRQVSPHLLHSDTSQDKPQSPNIKYCSAQVTTYTTTHSSWVDELIEYANYYCADPYCADQTRSFSLSDKLASNNLDADAEYFEGFMGFIGYDYGAKVLSPNNSTIQGADQPAAFIGHYDIYLTPCSDSGWQLNTNTDPQVINTVKYFLDHVEKLLSQPVQVSLTPALNLTPKWQFNNYADAFEKTQKFLYQGDSYQINLTQTWSSKRQPIRDLNIGAPSQTADLVNYLPKLHQNTNAPFAGYLGINNCGLNQSTKQYSTEQLRETNTNTGLSSLTFELLSCSPELFVVFHKDSHGEHKILTKPIKGTVPRGETPELDIKLKQQLADSQKDRAENVMIVDLLRNDLGKYAKPGTVKVPRLFDIESFSNVHHMVSSVTATIKHDIHPITVLFDSLPAGSITGTPKKRAVEIIAELEAGPRGAYCGTLGFMNFDGSGQWNVLIRSLQANKAGNVELWAGGGITVASQCEAEFQECLDKVGNLLTLLSD